MNNPEKQTYVSPVLLEQGTIAGLTQGSISPLSGTPSRTYGSPQ